MVINADVPIELQQISKVYHQGKKQELQAVTSLNFAISPGQIFGFLGPNGAGKTTTIKMICGLVKPTQGKIFINGYDVVRERWKAMQQIGAVLEGTRNIHWRLSAWQNLVYFGRLKGCATAQIKQRGEKLLRELELWPRRHTDVGEFSRGMQQQVAIACALIADPSIILLDEPTLGLDIQSARLVKGWILQLAREQGKTVILTTHQLDVAQALCDRVAIIRKGMLLADQPLKQLLGYFDRRSFYRIKVQGQLDYQMASRFADLTVESEDNDTILAGEIADQAALQAVLAKLLQCDLTLLSVTCAEATLEDVFVRLIEDARKGILDENHLTRALQ